MKPSVLILVAIAILVPPIGAQNVQTPNVQTKVTPKLEAVAETKLLMEGLANANFRGLERQLSQKDPDAQALTFARGQALLLAETANLLMLRPPKNEGQAPWFERAMELRAQSARLAQAIASKDVGRSRALLSMVSASCNRCHQTFRVNVEITPFEALPKAE